MKNIKRAAVMVLTVGIWYFTVTTTGLDRVAELLTVFFASAALGFIVSHALILLTLKTGHRRQ